MPILRFRLPAAHGLRHCEESIRGGQHCGSLTRVAGGLLRNVHHRRIKPRGRDDELPGGQHGFHRGRARDNLPSWTLKPVARP